MELLWSNVGNNLGTTAIDQIVYETWSEVGLSQGSSPVSMATRTMPQDQISAGSALYWLLDT